MPDIETKLRGYIEKTMNDEKFGKQKRLLRHQNRHSGSAIKKNINN